MRIYINKKEYKLLLELKNKMSNSSKWTNFLNRIIEKYNKAS